jgi:hypothetical protein
MYCVPFQCKYDTYMLPIQIVTLQYLRSGSGKVESCEQCRDVVLCS